MQPTAINTLFFTVPFLCVGPMFFQVEPNIQRKQEALASSLILPTLFLYVTLGKTLVLLLLPLIFISSPSESAIPVYGKIGPSQTGHLFQLRTVI